MKLGKRTAVVSSPRLSRAKSFQIMMVSSGGFLMRFGRIREYGFSKG